MRPSIELSPGEVARFLAFEECVATFVGALNEHQYKIVRANESEVAIRIDGIGLIELQSDCADDRLVVTARDIIVDGETPEGRSARLLVLRAIARTILPTAMGSTPC